MYDDLYTHGFEDSEVVSVGVYQESFFPSWNCTENIFSPTCPDNNLLNLLLIDLYLCKADLLLMYAGIAPKIISEIKVVY